jgi:Golgi nucleoside diphosphatase
MGKEGVSVDGYGNPYNYIVVIDAGSKGTRAHLYRATTYGSSQSQNLKTADDEDSDDGNDGDEVESKSTALSTWSVNTDSIKSVKYPLVQFIHRKKVKPGIANFVDSPRKLGKKYIGKLLSGVEKYIPEDQRPRTPVFLHATGGMRQLKPEDQSTILDEICQYIQRNTDFFLPDCATHINTISGEIEGLYSWIGLNYKFGVFDHTLENNSTYGALDMGGVSSQIAFEPSNIDANDEYFFRVQLNYLDPDDSLKFHYKVFSESFLGGMNQAHIKYDEKLIKQNDLVDPCLPDGYIKTMTSREGIKVDVKGSSDFRQCLNSLYSILDEISVDKYCNHTDATSAASCLLSDNFPKMDFNVKKLIGINDFYSNLKEFLNYKDCYEKAEKICSLSYTDLLQEKELLEGNDIEKTSEVCFKSSWIINILHQGIGFPRYGIDEVSTEDSQSVKVDDFAILDGFSWTLGRAVLYSFYEAASQMHNGSTMIGYYEPSSKVFVCGGEQKGIPQRPSYITEYYNESHDDDEKDHDDDTEDHDDDDWDDVLQEHRWWGSLLFLFILLIVVYLLMGRAKRQSISDAVRRIIGSGIRSNYYSVNESPEVEDLEMQSTSHSQGDEVEENQTRKKDSFEIE